MVLCLTILLTGCNSPVYVDKPIKIQPPEIYLEQTKFECKAKNNGDLWDCYLKAIDTINACNFDKNQIKDFFK
jgi:hypothetical protein